VKGGKKTPQPLLRDDGTGARCSKAIRQSGLLALPPAPRCDLHPSRILDPRQPDRSVKLERSDSAPSKSAVSVKPPSPSGPLFTTMRHGNRSTGLVNSIFIELSEMCLHIPSNDMHRHVIQFFHRPTNWFFPMRGIVTKGGSVFRRTSKGCAFTREAASRGSSRVDGQLLGTPY
jgi:hypothetical protein